MAAISLGTAGLTFGLTTETGGIIQNVKISKKRDKATVKNQVGEITAATYFNPTEEISFEHFPTGATGVAAASIGVALTMANWTATAGTIYPEEITITKPNNDYMKWEVKAVAHALI